MKLVTVTAQVVHVSPDGSLGPVKHVGYINACEDDILEDVRIQEIATKIAREFRCDPPGAVDVPGQIKEL